MRLNELSDKPWTKRLTIQKQRSPGAMIVSAVMTQFGVALAALNHTSRGSVHTIEV
jgi:hypothetical protein